MATLPLDLGDLLSELSGTGQLPASVSPRTTIGPCTFRFLRWSAPRSSTGSCSASRSPSGSTRVPSLSAGGYHHHLGANTWRSAGGSPPPPGAIGLREYEVVLVDRDARERVLDRLGDAGAGVEGHTVLDPSGNRLRLRVE